MTPRPESRPEARPEESGESLELARHARELLENEAFKAAITRLEAQYVAEWQRSDELDVRRREAAYWKIRVLEDVWRAVMALHDDIRARAAARERAERMARADL